MVLTGGVLLALYSIPSELRFYPLQTFRSTDGLKINLLVSVALSSLAGFNKSVM